MKTKLFSPDCLPDSVPSLRQRLSQGVCAESISVPAAVPIVMLNVSDFVAALERTEGGVTALQALECHLAILDALRQADPCRACRGTGKDHDPFRDAGHDTCDECKGAGMIFPATWSGLIGDVGLSLLHNLASDLRAAHNYVKGA
jgi:hypothetical protein